MATRILCVTCNLNYYTIKQFGHLFDLEFSSVHGSRNVCQVEGGALVYQIKSQHFAFRKYSVTHIIFSYLLTGFLEIEEILDL